LFQESNHNPRILHRLAGIAVIKLVGKDDYLPPNHPLPIARPVLVSFLFYFIFKKFHVGMAITNEISQILLMITTKPQPLSEVA